MNFEQSTECHPDSGQISIIRSLEMKIRQTVVYVVPHSEVGSGKVAVLIREFETATRRQDQIVWRNVRNVHPATATLRSHSVTSV
jgi:hypothetical protein